MKKIITTLAIALAGVSAQAGQYIDYVEAGIGHVSATDTVLGQAVNADGSALQLTVGKKLTDVFSAEANLLQSDALTLSTGGVRLPTNFRAQAIGVGIKAEQPVKDGFSVFGKAGVSHNSVYGEALGYHASFSRNDPYVAVGGSYAVDAMTKVSLEGRRINTEVPVTGYFLSLSRSF
jgi:hypothetical protein